MRLIKRRDSRKALISSCKENSIFVQKLTSSSKEPDKELGRPNFPMSEKALAKAAYKYFIK